MSEELARQLGQLQTALAQDWNRHGPEYVEQRVRQLDQEELVALVMLNIASQAHTG